MSLPNFTKEITCISKAGHKITGKISVANIGIDNYYIEAKINGKMHGSANTGAYNLIDEVNEIGNSLNAAIESMLDEFDISDTTITSELKKLGFTEEKK